MVRTLPNPISQLIFSKKNWDKMLAISFRIKLCQFLLPFCVLLVPVNLEKLIYQPEFDLPLPNVTAKQGTEVSFTCVVKHLGEFKVAWIKADDKVILAYHTNKVSHNPRYHVTHNGHNTWTLIIKNVQQDDSGSYMCQVNTNPMTAQIGYLEVVVPADIIDEETSSDVIVLEGQSAVLQCKARGYPVPKVRWRRQDKQPIPLRRELFNPGEKFYDWEGETLPLRPLSRTDNGAFLCIASNNIPPPMSKRVTVYVQFEPLIKVSNQLVAAPAEINVTLECEVESVPKPFISWTTRDGQFVMSSENKYNVTTHVENDYTVKVRLTIFNLEPKDFTDYNCSARNTLGESTGTVKLQRLYPPATSKPPTTTTNRNSVKPHSRDKSVDNGRHKAGNGRGHHTSHNSYDWSDTYKEYEGGSGSRGMIPMTTISYSSIINSNGHGDSIVSNSKGRSGNTSSANNGSTPPPWTNSKTPWGKESKNQINGSSSFTFLLFCKYKAFVPFFIFLVFQLNLC